MGFLITKLAIGFNYVPLRFTPDRGGTGVLYESGSRLQS